MLDLLGYVLTPLLIGSLAFIIVQGLLTATEVQENPQPNFSVFLHGLKEGYNTMDLLAAFFFSSVILESLRKLVGSNEIDPSKKLFSLALKASGIGAFLLVATYIGFSYVAAHHSSGLNIQSPDQLLGAISMKIAGPSAGILVCMTITLACLTTAIALSNVFADFLRKEVLLEKINYETALAISLIVTFFVSTFDFTGISAFLGPILQVCYPGLIVLTFLNIAHCLWKFKPVKAPVFLVFAGSIVGGL